MSRLTSSVLSFYGKLQIALDTRVCTQSGILTTVAVYQRPEAPSVLIIRALPLMDKVLDGHMLRRFANFSICEDQLASSRLEFPKNTPRILSLSATQVMFTGPVTQPAWEPIQRPSVFLAFSFEPEPRSKTFIISKALTME